MMSHYVRIYFQTYHVVTERKFLYEVSEKIQEKLSKQVLVSPNSSCLYSPRAQPGGPRAGLHRADHSLPRHQVCPGPVTSREQCNEN